MGFVLIKAWKSYF